MTDSAPERLRLFKSASSEQYAVLIWAFGGVEWVGQCLAKLRKLIDQSPRDDLICEALWTSAVVRLIGLFDGTYPLSREILKKMPDGAQDAFAFFKNYRDKHAAHKANPLEQVKVGVVVRPEDQGVKEILGVGHLGLNDASFADPKMIQSALEFAAALRKVLVADLELMSGRVLSEALSRPIDEIYALPAARVVVPESGYLHKGGQRAEAQQQVPADVPASGASPLRQGRG